MHMVSSADASFRISEHVLSENATDNPISDVAMQYAFARSEGHLEAEDFDPWMLKAAVGTSSLGQIAKQMYWFFWLVLHTPEWLARKLDVNGELRLFFQNMHALADTVVASRFLQLSG